MKDVSSHIFTWTQPACISEKHGPRESWISCSNKHCKESASSALDISEDSKGKRSNGVNIINIPWDGPSFLILVPFAFPLPLGMAEMSMHGLSNSEDKPKYREAKTNVFPLQGVNRGTRQVPCDIIPHCKARRRVTRAWSQPGLHSKTLSKTQNKQNSHTIYMYLKAVLPITSNYEVTLLPFSLGFPTSLAIPHSNSLPIGVFQWWLLSHIHNPFPQVIEESLLPRI